MRVSAPRQTFRPHGGDIFNFDGFVQLCRVNSYDCFVFFSWQSCTIAMLVFLPPIVRRFECIDSFLLSHRVRDAVPCPGGPDVEKLSPYFKPCRFFLQNICSSLLPVLSYGRISPCRSRVFPFNFKLSWAGSPSLPMDCT